MKSTFIGFQVRRIAEDKKVRYGGYALLTSLGMVISLVIVNLLVDTVAFEIDLTKRQLFTLSEQTFQVLDSLNSDVTIYQIGTSGHENQMISDMVARYVRRSEHVKTSTVDPERNPGLAAKYQKEGQLRPGGLIVESGELFRLLSFFDLFGVNMNTRRANSVSLEQELTSAVSYVTTGDLPIVYLLEGHSEISMFQLGISGVSFSDLLSNENYRVKTVNLTTVNSIPDDADLLLIVQPEQDLTSVEFQVLDRWLKDGGRAVFVMQTIGSDGFKYFEELLANYGIGLSKGLIVEGIGYHTTKSPFHLIPNMTNHEILSPIRNALLTIVLPAASPIKELELKRRTLNLESFLDTSEKSFLRSDFQIESFEQQVQESSGPFSVGMAITDHDLDGFVKSRIVVVSSILFLTEPYQANYDMLLNSMSWVRSREESVSIRPKSLIIFPLSISSLSGYIISGLSLLVIPLVIFGVGLIVWLRRRHL